MTHWRTSRRHNTVQTIQLGTGDLRRYYRLEHFERGVWVLVTLGPQLKRLGLPQSFTNEDAAKTWVATNHPRVAARPASASAHVLRFGPSGPQQPGSAA